TASAATACAAKIAACLGAVCAAVDVAASSDSCITEATAAIASPGVAGTRAINIARSRIIDTATRVTGGIVRASDTAPAPVSTATGAIAWDR
ncbi:hypothetical protein ACT18_24905, partial [Mycolicibacter kumamotonensis]